MVELYSFIIHILDVGKTADMSSHIIKRAELPSKIQGSCHKQLPDQPPRPLNWSILGISLLPQPNTNLNNLFFYLLSPLLISMCSLQEYSACWEYAHPLETDFFVVFYQWLPGGTVFSVLYFLWDSFC